MEITGKVIKILPVFVGQGRNGEWRKQEFILELETGSNFPKKLCLSVWGDKIETLKIAEGENAKVFFDAESREYNGRWFTECRAWRVEKLTGAASDSPAGDYPPPAESPFDSAGTPADDLPF
jgi:hypothetical protein